MTCSECKQRLYYLHTVVPKTHHQHQKWHCKRKKDALQTYISYYCFSISVMDLNAFLKWKWNEIMRKQYKFHKTQDSDSKRMFPLRPCLTFRIKSHLFALMLASQKRKRKQITKASMAMPKRIVQWHVQNVCKGYMIFTLWSRRHTISIKSDTARERKMHCKHVFLIIVFPSLWWTWMRFSSENEMK